MNSNGRDEKMPNFWYQVVFEGIRSGPPRGYTQGAIEQAGFCPRRQTHPLPRGGTDLSGPTTMYCLRYAVIEMDV
ncbi:MAG: hypothetical protein QOE77_3378 [Blastocatellia bacterium]|jgi:hypothetical protein|nr:hypothetical protein [Blastocatellia bacterium]